MSEEAMGKLESEIERLSENLRNFEPGSKEYVERVAAIEKLSEIISDYRKVNSEIDIKWRQLVNEDERLTSEFKQREQSKKDRLVDVLISVGTTLVTIVVPAAYKDKWFRNFLKFEETGSASSLLTRGFVSSLFRGK